MQEATQPTILSEAADPIAAAAYRAEAWAGEPFLHEGEDPAQALAPGTARRRALDDALAEIDAGRQRPSPQWKVRYGLMLGLERVLADPEPHTATGTPLRRHQIDAAVQGAPAVHLSHPELRRDAIEASHVEGKEEPRRARRARLRALANRDEQGQRRREKDRAHGP